jgi:hypothetical protein
MASSPRDPAIAYCRGTPLRKCARPPPPPPGETDIGILGGRPARASSIVEPDTRKSFFTGCPDPQRTKLDKLSPVSALRSAIYWCDSAREKVGPGIPEHPQTVPMVGDDHGARLLDFE